MRTFGLLLAAAVASACLSGCSMIPGVGSQTGVQACAVVSDSLQKAAQTFSSAISDAASDPSKAAAAVDQLKSDLGTARGKVTNADVGAALDKATTAVGEMSDVLKAAGKNPSKLDSDKFSAAAKQVQTAMGDFSTACTKI